MIHLSRASLYLSMIRFFGDSMIRFFDFPILRSQGELCSRLVLERERTIDGEGTRAAGPQGPKSRNRRPRSRRRAARPPARPCRGADAPDARANRVLRNIFFARFVARGGAISRARAVARGRAVVVLSRPFVRSLVRSLVRWFVRSFETSIFRSFDFSMFRLFDPSIFRSFDCSIIRSGCSSRASNYNPFVLLSLFKPDRE